MSALDSVARIRAFIEKAPELGDEAQWVAECLEQYLEGAETGLSMESAFGLLVVPGQHAWWTQVRRAERDEIIRTIAARHFSGADVTQTARELSRKAKRYQQARWKHEQHKAVLPPQADGTLHEMLWRAMKLSGGEFPFSMRHLCRILESDDAA